MSKKVKVFSIIILAIAVIIFVASRSSSTPPAANPDSPLSSSVIPGNAPAAPMQPAEDSDFTQLLSSVKSIAIDTSVFENPSFKALRDHPVMLGTDTVGRTNPFAPIGTDAATSTAFTIQTVQPGNISGTSAELGAQLTSNTTAPVTVVIQYGTSDIFGTATSPIVLTKSGPVLQVVSGLQPGTKYYVQAVAVAGSTTMPGNVMTFTTAAAPAR